MDRKIILITGGQRSGKSNYAQQIAQEKTEHPVYLATSRIWDDEFRERVRRHQQNRGPHWINLEEEKYLSQIDVQNQTVIVDCLTLWATNFFFDNHSDTDRTLTQLKTEFDRFTAQNAVFILVTNEIGMGGVSENPIQRRFTDLLGWLNQYVASKADEVICMISGIPLTIKG